MIYSVAVSSYEDNTSSMGEIITTYIVQVKYYVLLQCTTTLFMNNVGILYTQGQLYFIKEIFGLFQSLYLPQRLPPAII